MLRKEKEELIKTSFDAWTRNAPKLLNACFDNDIYYRESWGPQYYGIRQIHKWFTQWNKTGRVTQWTIKQFIHGKNITAVEWHFRADYSNGKKTDEFDGISLIEFNKCGKITSVKEFASKLPQYNPFVKHAKYGRNGL